MHTETHEKTLGADKYLADMNEWMHPGGPGQSAEALPTGLEELDRSSAGALHLGCLTVLADMSPFTARPLLYFIALHLAGKERKKTMYVSLDVGAQEISWGLACNCAGVEPFLAQGNRLRVEDWDRLTHGYEALRNIPLYVTDGFGLPFGKMGLEIDKLYDWSHLDEKEQLRLVIIDDLEHLSLGRAGMSRDEEVRVLLSKLRWIAHHLGIAILLLGRYDIDDLEWEARGPKPSDLRHHEIVCQECDTLLLLNMGHTGLGNGSQEPPSLHVFRNRLGWRCMRYLRWDREARRFTGTMPATELYAICTKGRAEGGSDNRPSRPS